jgi:hypothetical protein
MKFKIEREVITDLGIVRYEIQNNSVYDYLFLSMKKLEKKKIKKYGFFGKEKEVEIVNYKELPGESMLYYGDNMIRKQGFYLNKNDSKEQRINTIKKCIKSSFNMLESFDPEWDCVMVEDKSKLRDILINQLDIE